MAITHRWEKEAFDYWQQNPNDQLLFGLVQGGTFEECRRHSADALTQHDFSGFSIGGLSVGSPWINCTTWRLLRRIYCPKINLVT